MKSLGLLMLQCSLFLGIVLPVPAAESPAAKENTGADEGNAELVTFTADGAELHGFIWKPEGIGPFPAVLYNHGSEQKPGSFPTLGKFWTERGFVFFVPHRRGHGRSAGEWIVDLQKNFRKTEKDATLCQQHDVELHERANKDVVAAVAWLKQQPFVKADELVMSGISYGGIQTVLSAEKDLGVAVYIPFSPAAMSWAGNPPLRQRLLQTVENAKAPVFLLQAKNDYDLGPSELLGPALKRKRPPNQNKIYPVFGDADNHADGHGGFAVRGSAVWGDDVLSFVNRVLGKK